MEGRTEKLESEIESCIVEGDLMKGMVENGKRR